MPSGEYIFIGDRFVNAIIDDVGGVPAVDRGELRWTKNNLHMAVKRYLTDGNPNDFRCYLSSDISESPLFSIYYFGGVEYTENVISEGDNLTLTALATHNVVMNTNGSHQQNSISQPAAVEMAAVASPSLPLLSG